MSPPTSLDRMWKSFRALVRAELGELKFLGAYRYKVAKSSLGSVDVVPANSSLGLPSITSVPTIPGVLGSDVVAKVGAEAIVIFLEGSPSLPRCISLETIEEARIASGTAFAARIGDSVSVTILNASPLGPGPVTAIASISGGSSKVKIG